MLAGDSAMTPERFGYYPLDLAIDRTEFLRGPTLHEFHGRRVERSRNPFRFVRVLAIYDFSY